VTEDLQIGILPRIRWRDYDSYFGDPRRDLRFSVLAHAEWTPRRLTRLLPGAEIDLTLEYLRNSSTLAGFSYTRWEGGPALVFAWKF
jgi:hypothetical protein